MGRETNPYSELSQGSSIVVKMTTLYFPPNPQTKGIPTMDTALFLVILENVRLKAQRKTELTRYDSPQAQAYLALTEAIIADDTSANQLRTACLAYAATVKD